MKERELATSEEDIDERIIGNPIHAYKTVKRFAIDLKKIEQELQEDDWKGNMRLRLQSVGLQIKKLPSCNQSIAL